MPAKVPHFRRIMRDIREKIRTGELKPGDHLPTTEKLAEEYRVSPPTVRKAIDMLLELGVLDSRQGVAVWVAEKRE